jgi:type IV pilus assembly protein PilE
MQKIRGFTLIELMVVVAIVAILAGVSMAFFGNLADRARRADGKATLKEVALLQEKYRADNIQFATNLTAAPPAGLGYDGGETGCATCSREGHYTIGITAGDGNTDTDEYLITATPRNWTDSRCGTLTLDRDGPVETAAQIANNCWRR